MIKITSENLWEQVPPSGGVYTIIAIDENGTPIPVPRCLDIDTSGIIYIGQSINLQKRLTNFKKAVSPKYKSDHHIAARRYLKLIRFQERFPHSCFIVNFEVAQNHTKKEREVINAYLERFGDLPPLNRQ